ncbi:MAG TPA: transporter associated domain-containing protein [Gammaproteobacteria bacterium]|jgi:magnesium and cobalt transporter
MSDDTSSSQSQPGLSSWISRLFHGREDEAAGREEILEFLAECRKRGLLHADELAMLQGVLEVSQTHVREIMIPRSRMVVLRQDDSAEDMLNKVIESGHSRFPVIGADRDEVVGILLAKDVLRHYRASGDDFEIDDHLRPSVFIPESKRLNTLLKEFRESHQHMAVVVDEYGGVSGLATIEDVLEEIVGEIEDEHDPEDIEPIQELEGSRYSVLAQTRIDAFNEFFDTRFEEDEEYETVGGLILHELGRLPRRGERLELGGITFKVTRGDRRRIHAVEVTRPLQESGD